MKRRKEKDLISDLKTAYNLLAEVMENPSRLGYLALVKRIKPKSREPINIKLFDFQREVDNEIKKITYKILKKIGFYRLPDGMK